MPSSHRSKPLVPAHRNARPRLVRSSIALAVSLALAGPLQAQTERVSVSSSGEQANEWSERPKISADGRFVAFASDASNLVPGDTNDATDVFVHDRETGTTERVSISSTGLEGDSDSLQPSISADGRFVAFASDASNLVPNDIKRRTDVFVHDRETGMTERVSISPTGREANQASGGPSISADGRFVAFASRATNLVPGGTDGAFNVFVHDRETGTTELVSISSTGQQATFDRAQFASSGDASISADGRFIAFRSNANNLVPGDTNGSTVYFDVFVHDRETGATERVSVSSTGQQADGENDSATISADGRFVAFGSRATNLVPGDSNDWGDIFIHDRETGTTERVSVSSTGAQADLTSWEPSISADGRFVAFRSADPDLVPQDSNVRTEDVYVHDRESGTTERVSVSSTGEPTNGWSVQPSISADGRFIAFASVASNLVSGDTNLSRDIFVSELGRAPVSTLSEHSLATLPDTDGNAAAEIAAVLAGDTRALIHDSLTKARIDTLSLGTAAFAATGITDIGGSDAPELAVAVRSDADRYFVDIIDSHSGEVLNTFPFYAWRPIDIATLPSRNGYGARDIAVLTVSESDSEHFARIEIVDAANGGRSEIAMPMEAGSRYLGLTAVPPVDATGTPALAALRLLADGNAQIVVKTRENQFVTRRTFSPGGKTLVGLASVDLGADGPALAILMRKTGGRTSVHLRDAATGTWIGRMPLLSPEWAGRAITSMYPHTANSSVFAVLGTDGTRSAVQVIDAATRRQVTWIGLE